MHSQLRHQYKTCSCLCGAVSMRARSTRVTPQASCVIAERGLGKVLSVLVSAQLGCQLGFRMQSALRTLHFSSALLRPPLRLTPAAPSPPPHPCCALPSASPLLRPPLRLTPAASCPSPHLCASSAGSAPAAPRAEFSKLSEEACAALTAADTAQPLEAEEDEEGQQALMGKSLAQALRRAVRSAAQTLVWSFSSSGNSGGKGFQRNAAAEGSGKISGNAGSGLSTDSLASYDGLSSLDLDEGGFEGSSRCAALRTDRLGRSSWGRKDDQHIRSYVKKMSR